MPPSPTHRLSCCTLRISRWEDCSHILRLLVQVLYSPKTNMEPENHPFKKRVHLPNLPFLASMLVFGGTLHKTQMSTTMITMFATVLASWLLGIKSPLLADVIETSRSIQVYLVPKQGQNLHLILVLGCQPQHVSCIL